MASILFVSGIFLFPFLRFSSSFPHSSKYSHFTRLLSASLPSLPHFPLSKASVCRLRLTVSKADDRSRRTKNVSNEKNYTCRRKINRQYNSTCCIKIHLETLQSILQLTFHIQTLFRKTLNTRETQLSNKM